MPLQRVQQSKSQSPQTLSRPSSQFAPRPFAVQESEDPEASGDLESPDFDHDRFEATGLQLKASSGIITPVEQERLGTLQAKMDGVWAQRMERAQAQPSFLDILSRGTQSAQPSESGTPMQAKLTVGQPNDQYEQEADQVAAQVMRMPDTDEDEEDPDLQMQPAAPVEDSDEDTLHRQAIADTITPLVQRQTIDDGSEDEELQARLQGKTALVQRQTIDDSSEDEELQARLQGKTAQAPAVDSNFESQLSGQRGNGQPLPKPLKSSFENKFQAGFDNVRVHTDTASVQMSQAIGAQAFTHGNDIYFNSGKYNPGSSSGQELLAHELTHTIQQEGGDVQTKPNKLKTKLEGSGVQLRQDSPSQTEPAIPSTQRSASALSAESPAADSTPQSQAPSLTPESTNCSAESHGTSDTEAATVAPASKSPQSANGNKAAGFTTSEVSPPAASVSTTSSPQSASNGAATTAAVPATSETLSAETSSSISANPAFDQALMSTAISAAPEVAPKTLPQAINSSGITAFASAPSDIATQETDSFSLTNPSLGQASTSNDSGIVPSSIAQFPKKRGGESDSNLNVDSNDISPEYVGLIQELVAQNKLIHSNAEHQKAQLITTVDKQKKTIQQKVEAKALQVEVGYHQVITRIQDGFKAQRQSVYAGLESERARVNASAEAEIAQLEAAVAGKQKIVVEKGSEKVRKAREIGSKEARRAQQGSNKRGQRVQEIGNQKTAQYRNGENGAAIVSSIRSEVPKLAENFFQIGNDVASSVHEKAGEVAGHFSEEAREIAGEFNKSQGDARQQILDNRDKTLESLKKMADDAVIQLGNEANNLVQKLSADQTSKASQIRELAPGLSASLDENVTNALIKIDTQTASTSQELNSFAEQVKEGGWYPPFVQDAKTEVLASIAAQQSEQQQFVAQVVGSFAQAASTAQGDVTGQAQTIISAVEQVGNDFQTNARKIADDTKGQMQEASAKGEDSMKLVTQEVEKKLQEAVDKSDSEWETQLSEKATEIAGQVDEALAKEDSALNDFSAEIDARAARAADPGILEAIWDFVAGVFEGIVIGAWETLKAIWEAIKTPLFWIVVAVVVVVLVIAVVVLVIKGAAVLAAIGAVLAFAGKVLLVIGIIVGVIAAGYYIYLMITQPDLSPRERGRLMGRAIFEVIMAFAGTGILKRLGVFAQLDRLRQLVARVGSVAKALRLINKVPNLEKLFLLLDKVGDADKLIQLLDKVNDADKLIQLLDKVGDVTKLTQLLNKVGDANKLIQLLDRVNDVDKLIQLLAKVEDADQLAWLLDKVSDVKRLGQLLDDVGDAEILVRLLSTLENSNPNHLPALLQQIREFGLSPSDLLKILEEAKQARDTGIPLGIPEELFVQASQNARQILASMPYGDDIVVQGSRVRGYSMDFVNGVLQPVLKRLRPDANTDVDVALRLSQEAFDAAISRSFGPNPGSAKARTMQKAIEDGRIFGGHARPNLRQIRRAIAHALGMPEDKVQVTLVKIGASFDAPPGIPLTQ